ncbi:hypothetical protein PIB30_006064 [Stylosanthes scabra]|uniref:No apical meristem-associated C-terminal domain-containing protein n=1 Tax=Stylosanthes scabra TaxID=79078 RepID=A0ABU6V3H9_9FABA|nr:hypothetical protein [Stylosanthes scabra]
MFNPSISNIAPTSFPFPSQFSALRPDLVGFGAFSNSSSQTPIHSSPNSQCLEFANFRKLDVIDPNNDEIENQRQDDTLHWQWEEDEMLISAWLNIFTDPVVSTDQKGDTFWNWIHTYCEESNPTMIRGSSAYYGQKFTFKRHWNAFRLEQKWRNQVSTQIGGSKRTKVSATGAYSSSSNPETPIAEDAMALTHPFAHKNKKKSKRRGKGKAQMDEDHDKKKSSIVKQLCLMEDIKNVREKELLDGEKEREEEKEHREKIVATKEKEL